MKNEYGIVKKETNEIIHTFKSLNNKTSTQDALSYLMGLGLSVTFIKSNFKVVGFVTNQEGA